MTLQFSNTLINCYGRYDMRYDILMYQDKSPVSCMIKCSTNLSSLIDDWLTDFFQFVCIIPKNALNLAVITNQASYNLNENYVNVEVNSNNKEILTGIEVNMQFLKYSHYEGQQNCIFTENEPDNISINYCH